MTHIVEACARAAHEANRAYQIAIGEDVAPRWEDWPEERAAGVRRGVQRVLAGEGPRQLHEAWKRDMVANGWVEGPVKDPIKKTHPCIVPYDHLPKKQRVKDDLFTAVVAAMNHVLDEVSA